MDKKFEYGVDVITLLNTTGIDLSYKYAGNEGVIEAYKMKGFYDEFMAKHIEKQLLTKGVVRYDYDEKQRKLFPTEDAYLNTCYIKGLANAISTYEKLQANEERYEAEVKAANSTVDLLFSKKTEFEAIKNEMKRCYKDLTGSQFSKAKSDRLTYKKFPSKEKETKKVNTKKTEGNE